MFTRSSIAMLLIGAVACVPLQAHELDACHIESDYDLTVNPDALVFVRDAGAPLRVQMAAGRLTLDGRDQSLSEADTRRVAKFERELRALVPEVRAIALEGVALATESVLEVAGSLGGVRPEDLAGLRAIGSKLSHRIEMSNSTADWQQDALDTAVDEFTAQLTPMLAGDIASTALSALMQGDTNALGSAETRAADLQRELESRIEAQGAPLKARAERMCTRVVALDRLENELELRLPGGGRLDVLQARMR